MPSNSNIERAANVLRETLDLLGWEPEQVEGDTIYSVDFGPPHLPVSGAVAAIIRPDEVFVIYFNFGVIASPERRDEVARFLALVNSELVVGELVMDYDDGHVRCKSSVDFHGDELSDVLIRNAIAAAMQVVETYGDATVAVIAHDADAVDAFEEAQKE
jgi:hypothetical protein